MSPAGKRLILFLSVLVVLLGAARVLSGGRSRTGSHFGWMESETKGTEGEEGSSPGAAGGAVAGANVSPGGPGSAVTSAATSAVTSIAASTVTPGMPANGPTAGPSGSATEPGSSSDAPPGAPGAASAGAKASGGSGGKPSGDESSPSGSGKTAGADDDHDQADSRADDEAGAGRAGANADRPSSNQVDAGDLSTASFHVASSRSRASEDVRLSHDNGAFFIRYLCQPYPSRDCTCPQLEKPVDEGQVNELLHLVQTGAHGPADALLTAELGLRDGSSRSLSLNLARSPVPDIFDIHCQ